MEITVLKHELHELATADYMSNSYISRNRGFVQIIPPSWDLIGTR